LDKSGFDEYPQDHEGQCLRNTVVQFSTLVLPTAECRPAFNSLSPFLFGLPIRLSLFPSMESSTIKLRQRMV
jgi:hypothetical protein